MNKKQLNEAFDLCRHWANAPEPQIYWADVAVMVNLLSVGARRAGAEHLAEPCKLCTPREGMNVIGRMLASLPPESADVVSLNEAARILGMSASGLRKVVRRGAIRFSQSRPHSPIKFRREWLGEYVERGSQTGEPAAKRQPKPKSAPPVANRFGL
jgi:hypothetical protein